MTTAPLNIYDVPPYQLQPLIQSVIQHTGHDVGLGGRTGNKAHAPKVEVTCAQALGSEIYIGCSDGALLRYALQADDPNASESYKLLSRQSLPTNKAIDEIALAPSISRVLILSDHQIHFYTFPSLDPVPPQLIKPIRNVIHFAIDDQHMRRPPPSLSDSQHVDPIEFCVIKRNNIAMYSLKDRLFFQQEIPIPPGARLARRTGQRLCLADAENYNMIDLRTASLFPLLPISQVPDETSPAIKPSITVIGEEEFLILSSIGVNTMGVFINGNGDPVRGTLEWPSHPESLCLDYPYTAALLPNQTIEVHSLETQSIAQVILPTKQSSPRSSPSSSAFPSPPRILSASLFGFLVPSTERTEKLRLTSIPLIVPSPDQSTKNGDIPAEEHSSEPNLRPPPPAKPSNSPASLPVFPRSTALVLSENSVQSLLPSTLISQAESLLENHRIEETVELADQHRRKLLGNITVDEDQAEELRYVYQRVGFQCLSETLFEDAGKHLLAGEVDPRMLVRYFPDLRGALFDATSTLDVYAGVAAHLPSHGSIDDIVVANLVRNYSPHLAPNTREAPPTAELRRVLGTVARDMLAAYLRKCRTRRLLERSKGVATGQNAINAVVDTVLVKILAESEKTTELYNLVDEPNDIVLTDVKDTLTKNGQYNALCKLYENVGDVGKLLEALSFVADGVWADEDISSPLTKMVDLLKKTTDRALVQQWGIWLLQKDAERGLDLLISRDFKRSSKADDASMLQRIRDASASAGAQYLEYLVLRKRSNDGDLHMQLAMNCVEQLLQATSNEATAKLWRAKASSYGSGRNDNPFLLYFASTTPESEHKRVRLKTALFLQGSNLYDVEEILRRLEAHQKLLQLEVAILFGKLGRHQDALGALVHAVRDATSAEAYCTLGGDVVPARVALAVGERCALQPWAALVAGADVRQKTADEATKRALLRVLLEVYMRDGKSTADRTARLLNSQAINLDVVDVISLVPPDWPLSAVSSFLARSLRRALHERHEGQILKAISAGQNLEVADKTWLVLREQGAVVEEADGSDAGGDNEKKAGGDEKSLTEKNGLNEISGEVAVSSVAEVNIDSRKEIFGGDGGLDAAAVEA